MQNLLVIYFEFIHQMEIVYYGKCSVLTIFFVPRIIISNIGRDCGLCQVRPLHFIYASGTSIVFSQKKHEVLSIVRFHPNTYCINFYFISLSLLSEYK